MKERYKLKNGTIVEITVDEIAYDVTVTDTNSDLEVGGMRFSQFEGGQVGEESLYLTWAYLDQAGDCYKYQGIGRKCLELAKKVSGMQIAAAFDDGQRKDDGSHLTGDAPGFVARMRQEGIIV